MPEYRRFIAYFYEYIDGKKQKNTGFAKVELRNGMWRILFRITTDLLPEMPVQVYGFVRENGFLLGLPMGTLRSGKEIVEEWAYRADSPIGNEKYCFSDFAGIWIKSSDERCFITVWDDEPLELERFVLELPMEDGIPERPLEEWKQAVPGELQKEENQVTLERPLKEADQMVPERMQKEADQVMPEKISEESQETESSPREITAFELQEPEGELRKFLQRRTAFFPFQDDEITDCVQLRPCDVVWLQQNSWKVGRSSFLQHGFYQHRHLLLGRGKDGGWILGVPGIFNSQEQYMAELFGYKRFKPSKICDCGKKFGYWYRPLTK